MTDAEQQRYWLACHEAAHAIIAHVFEARVDKVAIGIGANVGEPDGSCWYTFPDKKYWKSIVARIALAASAFEVEILGITCHGNDGDFESAMREVGGKAWLDEEGLPHFSGQLTRTWWQACNLVINYRKPIESLAGILYQHGTLDRRCLPGILKWAMTDEDQTGECCHQCGMRFEHQIAA